MTAGPGPKGLRRAPTPTFKDQTTSSSDLEIIIYVVMPFLMLVLMVVSGVLGYKLWKYHEAKENEIEVKQVPQDSNVSAMDDTTITEIGRAPTQPGGTRVSPSPAV